MSDLLPCRIKDVIGNYNNMQYDFFSVHIMLTYGCNFDCPYCNAGTRRDDKLINKKFINLDGIKIFLNNYRKYVKKPLALALTGGEPIIYPQFKELINLIKDNDDIVYYTGMITNGSGNFEDYQYMLETLKNKSSLNISYHPCNPLGFDYYLNLYKKLTENRYKFDTTILADDERLTIEQLKDIINKVSIYDFMIKGLSKHTYSNEFKDLIDYYENKRGDYLTIQYDNGKVNKVNQTEIKKLNYNPFKNMCCDSLIKNLLLSVDLNLTTFCASSNSPKCYVILPKKFKKFFNEILIKRHCLVDECYYFNSIHKWVE